MPTVGSRVSVPANSVVDVIAGTEFEFPGPRGTVVGIAAVTEGAGVVLDVTFGQKRIADGIPLELVAANIAPRIPDNLRVKDAAMPGEKIRVLLRNTTGAAVVASALVDLT